MLIKISTNHISWIIGDKIPYNKRVNVCEYITQLGDEGREEEGLSGQAFRLSDSDPRHALSEISVQFLILRAGQGIPCRSKTLDAAAARLAP